MKALLTLAAVGLAAISFFVGYQEGRGKAIRDGIRSDVVAVESGIVEAEHQHDLIKAEIRRLEECQKVGRESYLNGALFGHFAARGSISWRDASNIIVNSWRDAK
jgi:hypothetical protein